MQLNFGALKLSKRAKANKHIAEQLSTAAAQYASAGLLQDDKLQPLQDRYRE